MLKLHDASSLLAFYWVLLDFNLLLLFEKGAQCLFQTINNTALLNLGMNFLKGGPLRNPFKKNSYKKPATPTTQA